LALEWNSIGLMTTNSFANFCQSLGMNKKLKDLDLRNNQITHTGAMEIAGAIEVNTTLENLGRVLFVFLYEKKKLKQINYQL
jgi:hypothetical protein